jgi:hypothetical protein
LVIDTLNNLDTHFDAASIDEITMLLARGVDPRRIIFTDPVKTVNEIADTLSLGINAFAFDSLSELRKLLETAPRADYFLRLAPAGNVGVDDHKFMFGASPDEASKILDHARDNSLPLSGISIAFATEATPGLVEIASVVAAYQAQFPAEVNLVAELGRYVAGPAAAIRTEGSSLTSYDVGAHSTAFFTDFDNLFHPNIIMVDSKYSQNVTLAIGNMEICGIRAQRTFEVDEIVFQVTGYFTETRTRTSFQTDTDRHIEPTIFGAFLNHSCDPNVGVSTNKFGSYDIFARRHIDIGEDIAPDYAMFEYETGHMSLVPCLCGSDQCRTHITGYKDLSNKQRQAYEGSCASYLLTASSDRDQELDCDEAAA